LADSPFKHGDADASPGFLLWKLTALWQRKLGEVLGELAITQTQYAILASLRWFQVRLRRRLAKIDKMTLSKAIRKLEDAGLLARESSPEDSRAMHVRFTAKGRKLVQQAVVAIENADDEFFSALGPRQLADYKGLTKQLIAGNG